MIENVYIYLNISIERYILIFFFNDVGATAAPGHRWQGKPVCHKQLAGDTGHLLCNASS